MISSTKRIKIEEQQPVLSSFVNTLNPLVSFNFFSFLNLQESSRFESVNHACLTISKRHWEKLSNQLEDKLKWREAAQTLNPHKLNYFFTTALTEFVVRTQDVDRSLLRSHWEDVELPFESEDIATHLIEVHQKLIKNFIRFKYFVYSYIGIPNPLLEKLGISIEDISDYRITRAEAKEYSCDGLLYGLIHAQDNGGPRKTRNRVSRYINQAISNGAQGASFFVLSCNPSYLTNEQNIQIALASARQNDDRALVQLFRDITKKEEFLKFQEAHGAFPALSYRLALFEKDILQQEILFNQILESYQGRIPPNVLFKTGINKKRLGKYDEAEEYFDRSIRLYLKLKAKIPLEILVEAADLKLKISENKKQSGNKKEVLEKEKEALFLYEKAIQENKESVGEKILIQAAKLSAKFGNYHQADDCYTVALEFIRKDVGENIFSEYLISAAHVKLKLRETIKAEELFDDVEQEDLEETFETLYTVVQVKLKRKKNQEALSLLEKGLIKFPEKRSDPNILLTLALINFHTGDHQAVERIIDEVLNLFKQGKEKARTLLGLAKLRVKLCQYDLADLYMERAFGLFRERPLPASILKCAAEIKMNLCKEEEAKELNKRAFHCYINEGTHHFNKKLFLGANQLFEQAFKICPELIKEAHLMYSAKVKAILGKIEETEECLNKIRARHKGSSSSMIFHFTAEIKCKIGKWSDADLIISEALSKGHEDDKLIDSMILAARIKFKLNLYSEAFRIYQDIVAAYTKRKEKLPQKIINEMHEAFVMLET